ncbi:MAG TPA: MFS transporter [Acidimicrobiales bacterium]|nr:MFS transporter [Acidimicrobiales bacterium]
MNETGRLPIYRFGLLWLIGANLRMAVLALPPVLPDIQHQFHLGETAVGALTTLPILLLALGAVVGSAAVARLGPRVALAVGLVIVGLSSGARGLGGAVGLFIASVALGIGIAVLQPTMPSITRVWFATRVGFATSVYSNGIVVGEALAASLTLPLIVPLTGSWQKALALWGLPALVGAALLALPVFAVPLRQTVGSLRWWPRWTDSVTWRVGLLQGGGSVLYFGTNAFLPTYLHAAGHPGLVAPGLAALNTAQLAGAFIVAVFARRGSSPHGLLAICAICAVVALGAIVVAPAELAIAGAAVVGICSAVAFTVSLAMPALLAGPEDVHRLAAGMTTIGYLAAFLFPLAGGIAWQVSGNSALAFVPEALGAVFFGTVLSWPGRSIGRSLAVRIQ